MAEHANEAPNQNNYDNQAMGFMNKAVEACASGDFLLGMHLYLAAYEKAALDPAIPASAKVAALRQAWQLACDLKERSMAEYVFEKLEPYLTGDEIAACAQKLQELALDRLEEYGFSRQELEDIAESISQDFLGDNAHVVKVESVSIPNVGMIGVPLAASNEAAGEDAPEGAEAQAPAVEDTAMVGRPHDTDVPKEKLEKPPHVGMGVASVDDFNPYDMYNTSSVGKSYHAATVEGSGAYVFTRDTDRATELERANEKAAAEAEKAKLAQATESGTAEGAPANGSAGAVPESAASEGDSPRLDLSKFVPPVSDVFPNPMADEPTFDSGVLNYSNLVGYDQAIEIMHDLGVGMQGDPDFIKFVRMLNDRHGIDRMPAVDTLLFRAPAIEDADRFVEATAGELGLPVLRMSMEEGMGGAPVLCVTTQGNNRPRMNHAHNRFEAPGILVIEDLDSWIVPDLPDSPEGFAGFMMANISRGAREAVNLIRASVEDPDVFVLATSSAMGEADPFFYELLEPITIVDIGYPNEKERADIWAQIAEDHPSIRGVNVEDLVRFSEGMVRYDMYMAAREALEEAYKTGLVQRTFVPVTPQNLFDKIAACHPLDSDMYRAIEQAVLNDFRTDLDHLEDLFGGEE